MALIEPIFNGARARCRNHSGVVLDVDEEKCLDCRIEERNLSMRPPFDVLCTDATWGMRKGERYTVKWVIRDATTQGWAVISGYVFLDSEGEIEDHIYEASKFIPDLYLSEDGKDEWRIGPEKEWQQPTPKEAEYNEQGLENVG